MWFQVEASTTTQLPATQPSLGIQGAANVTKEVLTRIGIGIWHLTGTQSTIASDRLCLDVLVMIS